MKDQINKIVYSYHHNPFEILGKHSDAIRAFKAAALDYLAIGNFLIKQ